MTEIATKSTRKIYPIDNPKRIDISLHFTDEQFAELKKGFIPYQMEEKWFIYFEDEWLYFHRSWTGYGFYKAQILNEGDGYSIKEFWVERNPEKYLNENDIEDIDIISFVIARFLLKVVTRFNQFPSW